MSEKRFILDSDFVKVTSQVVWDNQEEKGLTLMKLVNLLNEQQELIEELHISDHMGWKRAEHFEKELKTKKIYIKRLEYKVQKFKEMNNEQQDTIKKLQDLCGESDGENAKLRIENKKLKDDLHNCRLNKNIIREKLKLWQDVHKEYNIYNIKDFEKLMKKVK